MEKIDMRALSDEELYYIRQQVIQLRKKRLTRGKISEKTGVSLCQTSRIWSAYKNGGLEALKPKKRGAKLSAGKLLNKEQEREIYSIISNKMPYQLKMGYTFWTRQAVSDLIMSKYKIKLSLNCVTRYLRAWGFKHNVSKMCNL